MKTFLLFGLCGLLAPGLFAGHQAGGAVSGGHAAGVAAGSRTGHAPGSAQTSGKRRHGYGAFYGGYYEPFGDHGYSPVADSGGSNTTIIQSPPAEPMVVETAHPVIHEYPPPPEDTSPILYLIAFRDSTIREAMTYWIENDALHYLDIGHQLKQAPLASIDRELSARLNRERHVPFNIQ